MASIIVTINRENGITIPAILVEKLGLKVGSRIELEKEKDYLILKPLGEDLEKLFKEAKTIKPKLRLTAEEMDEINERMFR